MSNYGFRNALQGKVDYAYRYQLNSYVVGGGLNNALWVCYRKETSHLLELFCSKKIERVETRILAPSAGWLQYTPETPIEDDEWQRAEVTHPFDPNSTKKFWSVSASSSTPPRRIFRSGSTAPNSSAKNVTATMPGAAIQTGAVDFVMPLDEIACAVSISQRSGRSKNLAMRAMKPERS